MLVLSSLFACVGDPDPVEKADTAAFRDTGHDSAPDTDDPDTYDSAEPETGVSDTDTGVYDTDTGVYDTDTGVSDTGAPDTGDTAVSETGGVSETGDTGVPDTGDTAACAATWYADTDGDGFGDASVSTIACDVPLGYVADATDCDDGDAAVYPGAAEDGGNGVDDDCDGVADVLTGASADGMLVGEASMDYAGSSVAIPGDVNGDGYDDLLVGAYHESSAGVHAGAAYLVYGPVTGTVSLADAAAKLQGHDVEGYLGQGLGAAGDVDGDGVPDLIVGASNADDGGLLSGAAFVVSGTITGTSVVTAAGAELVGEDAADYAGMDVTGVGDLDADGYDDVMVGAIGDDDGGSYAGAAYLVAGPITGTRSLAPATAKLVGEVPDDEVGHGLARAGDLDGDGTEDLAIGAWRQVDGGYRSGAVYVVFGPVTGTLDLSPADAKLMGASGNDLAGVALAGAGDTDGDGYRDLWIGADGEDTAGTGAGAAFLACGPFSGTSSLSSAAAKVEGAAASDFTGGSVAGLGDLDADGYDDVLVGAELSDRLGSNGGAAFLFHGPLSGTWSVTDADATFAGADAGDWVGSSLAGGGDVDGDGTPDLVVGALGQDDGGASAGAVYVFAGAGL